MFPIMQSGWKKKNKMLENNIFANDKDILYQAKFCFTQSRTLSKAVASFEGSLPPA